MMALNVACLTITLICVVFVVNEYVNYVKHVKGKKK